MKFSYNLIATALGLVVVSTATQAAPLTINNLVVERIGDGSGALSNAAMPVFLDEYTKSGSLVQSLAMPTAAGPGVSPLTDSGTATSDGYISRTTDGKSLVVPGYLANVGTAALASSSSVLVPREVATVSANGSVKTTSLGNIALSGNNVRSAASVDGLGVYVGGANGVAYVNTSTSAVNMLTSTSLSNRSLVIADNELYYSTEKGTGGIYALGTGLPTSGTFTGTLIAASASPYAFMFADLSSSVAGVDTLYVADDTSSTGGIRKFSKSSAGTWALNNTLALSGVRGLTGAVNAGQVQLFATTGSTLFGLLDGAGYNANLSSSITTLAAASANTVYRGVSLTPAVPEPTGYLLAVAGLAWLGRGARRRA